MVPDPILGTLIYGNLPYHPQRLGPGNAGRHVLGPAARCLRSRAGVHRRASRMASRAPQSSLIARHAPIDRVFHWVTAVAVLLLLGSAFLPILGLEFSWVPLHWMTGVVLCL